jgi:hypothetical protein
VQDRRLGWDVDLPIDLAWPRTLGDTPLRAVAR